MSKTSLLAIVVMAVLGGFAYLAMDQKPQAGIAKFALDFETKSVDRIVVEGDKAIELNRVGEDWMVGKQRADNRAVERLLESLAGQSSTAVVSQDPSKFGGFELAEGESTSVALWSGSKALSKFVVGKSSKSGSYVKHKKKVFDVKRISAPMFSKDRSAWLRMKLFEETIDSLKKVKVQLADGQSFTMLNSDGTWSLEDRSVLPKGFRFDDAAAKRWVNSLLNMRAKDVLENDPGVAKTGLGEKTSVFSLHLSDDKKLELRLGASTEDNNVYAQASGFADVLVLNKSGAQQILKGPSDFRRLDLVDIDIAKVSALNIKDGRNFVYFKKSDEGWTQTAAKPKADDGFTFDPAQVQARLAMLKRFKASEYLGTQATVSGLAKPSASVEAILEGGEKVLLAFGASQKDDAGKVGRLVRGNADDSVYWVTEGSANRILGLLGSFKKREQPAGLANLDPSTLSNLPPEIRKQLEVQIQQQKMQEAMMKQMNTAQ